MVIVAGSLSSFWEVKLRFLWFLAGICPAFFPKTFYIQAGPVSLLPFSCHTIYFLNRLRDKTAFLWPCHNMIQNGCSKAYVAVLFFLSLFFLFLQFTLFFFLILTVLFQASPSVFVFFPLPVQVFTWYWSQGNLENYLFCFGYCGQLLFPCI